MTAIDAISRDVFQSPVVTPVLSSILVPNSKNLCSHACRPEPSDVAMYYG